MTSKSDMKRVDKLVKGIITDEGDDESGGSEAKELESIIEDNHANYSKISRHYKLFEYVAKSDPGQVLRYVKERNPAIEPLWMSEKGLPPTQIPPCLRCGGPRLFECQVMPRIFDELKELLLVDWNTIVVYTCTSSTCYPDFSKDEHYISEYSFVQFSDDFSRVQYGDASQIKKQEQAKRVEENKDELQQQQEQQPGDDKKKKKKSKKSKGEVDPSRDSEQIALEQQSQLQDLLKNLEI